MGTLVRLRDADALGYVTCCTCSKRYAWNDTQALCAGHWIPKSRGNYAKYELTNVHGQCTNCNIWHSGMPHEYEQFMAKKYGRRHMERMREASRKTMSLSLGQVEEKSKLFISKLAELGCTWED